MFFRSFLSFYCSNLTSDNWRSILFKQIENADWSIVSRDVVSFLERPDDLKIVTKENVLPLVLGER